MPINFALSQIQTLILILGLTFSFISLLVGSIVEKRVKVSGTIFITLLFLTVIFVFLTPLII